MTKPNESNRVLTGEEKMKIVIDNYFKTECNVDTSIREAFGKGFRIGATKRQHGYWIDIDSETYTWKIRCNKCGHERSMMSTGQIYPMYCENCGARMDGKGDHEKAD